MLFLVSTPPVLRVSLFLFSPPHPPTPLVSRPPSQTRHSHVSVLRPRVAAFLSAPRSPFTFFPLLATLRCSPVSHVNSPSWVRQRISRRRPPGAVWGHSVHGDLSGVGRRQMTMLGIDFSLSRRPGSHSRSSRSGGVTGWGGSKCPGSAPFRRGRVECIRTCPSVRRIVVTSPEGSGPWG